jgi:eukaryotic-like serine/threonine-protein kinase
VTTRDGSIKGKFAYMAPEQIRGQPLTRRTDVFAAAVVLWELVTGQRLFEGANDAEEMYKCLQGAIEPPSRREPSVPPAFDAIVLRGLARDPEQRYESARAMAADLERAAPAVRASEVGAWVGRLAGETLAARAAVIAEMERQERPGDATPASVPSTTSSPETPMPAGGVVLAEAERSQVSHPGVVAERPASPAGGPSRLRRFVVSSALAGLLAGGALGAATLGHHSPTRAAADAPPVSSASSVVAPPVAAATESAAASEPAPTAVASTVATTPSAASSAKPLARPGKRMTPRSCDPPYTLDSRGREVFKVECL